MVYLLENNLFNYMTKQIYTSIATVFGIGKNPFIIPSLIFFAVWPLKNSAIFSSGAMGLFLGLFILIGIVSINQSIQFLSTKDITIDKAIGAFISLAFVPNNILLYVFAFINYLLINFFSTYYFNKSNKLSAPTKKIMQFFFDGIFANVVVYLVLLISLKIK